MSPARRETILASLRAGNWIYMRWTGSHRNGQLQYSLHGVSRLREAEVEELKREGLLAVLKRGEMAGDTPYRNFTFKPYRIKTQAEML